MKKWFSAILVLAFVLVLGNIGYSQEVKKLRDVDKIGDIVEIPGASEYFVAEGFHKLSTEQKEFIKHFMSMVGDDFGKLVRLEFENWTSIKMGCYGARGVTSERFAIVFHNYAVGLAINEKKGKIIFSDLAILYYLDELPTEDYLLSQKAQQTAQKFLDSIKEKTKQN